MIKKAIINLLRKRGMQIKNIEEYKMQMNFHVEVLRQLEKGNEEEIIDSIIFSKDRAIQLHAFIESYFDMVEGAGTLIVLYKATGNHVKSYEELKSIWSEKDVVFVEESRFKEQLDEICEKSTARMLGFYVDDMIFTQEVSYNDILKYPTSQYIACFSRGGDFTYSQVCGKPCAQPKLTQNGNFLEFAWNEDIEYSDWKYPLGVSAFFYSRSEITAMFRIANYKAPNSLEMSMQHFLPFFDMRKGLCMDKVACVCVPINLVQEECVNPTTDHVTVQELLEKWNEGLKIDISKFHGVGTEGVFMNYDYVKRNK